jgi:hypothetical protein
MRASATLSAGWQLLENVAHGWGGLQRYRIVITLKISTSRHHGCVALDHGENSRADTTRQNDFEECRAGLHTEGSRDYMEGM